VVYVIYQQEGSPWRRYVDQDGCQRSNIKDAYAWNNVNDMIGKAYYLRKLWKTPYIFWEKVDD